MDANFKRTHMDNWMHLLYGEFPKYYKKTLEELIITNTKLHDNLPNATDIMYVRGTAYYYNIAAIGSNPNRYELHLDIQEQVLRLFNDKIEIADEIVIIQGYLRRILNLCTIEEDIKILLPNNIKDHFKGFMPSITTRGTTITAEVATKFKHRNKQFSNLISERILVNLLLAG